MSVKKSYRELLAKGSAYIFSVTAGAGAAAALLAVSALAMYVFQLPVYFAEYLSLLSFGTGCMVSGWVGGKLKKRHGLRIGFRCGVVMLALCGIGALLCGSLDGSAALAKTITAVITGCSGGVIGVNRVVR